MILVGLILVLAGIAAVVGIASTGGSGVHVDFFGMSAGHHDVGAVFAAGAVAGLIFALGVMLLHDGVVRRRRRRREIVAQRQSQVDERQQLRERNAELERTLAAERSRDNATTHSTASNEQLVDR